MGVFCRADQRRRNIEQMWAPDGRLAVSSLGLIIERVDDINAQISQVRDHPIADKGLAFTLRPTHRVRRLPAAALVDARAERRELAELLKRLIPDAPVG
jgi:hypothetical protein